LEAIVRTISFVFFVCLATGAVMAQAGDIDKPLPLKVTAERTIDDAVSSMVLDPIQCDANGNVFFQVVEGTSRTPAIRKLSFRDARSRAISIPTGQVEAAQQFAVDRDGGVHQLGWDEKSIFILRFDKEGNFQKKIALDGQFMPVQIVVFGSGEYLVAGRKGETDHEAARPFTAIFDPDGKLKQELNLDDDAKITKAVELGDSAYVNPVFRNTNRAVDLGAAVPGSDGDVLLMRWMAPAVIYSIAPSGKVTRRLEVAAPEGMKPNAIQAAKGTIGILFREESGRKTLIKVVNAQTGEELHAYEPKDVAPVFACMSEDAREFIFITSRDRKFVLQKAQ
jgi:hypothetical protein